MKKEDFSLAHIVGTKTPGRKKKRKKLGDRIGAW